LAEFKNAEELKAWLETQPREVAVALAVRAALRVLPLLQSAQSLYLESDFFADSLLPVFRATAVSWVSAKYPGQAPRFDVGFAVTDHRRCKHHCRSRGAAGGKTFRRSR
jgi:hypothetical protein